MQTDTEANANLDLIWGAQAIGAAINRNTRITFGLLEAGAINGATKIGGRWCVSRHHLRQQFGLTEVA